MSPGTPTSSPYPPGAGSSGRISWLSGLAGFVVGALMVSFVWVQVLATFVENDRDQGELVFVPISPDGLPDDDGEAGGAQRRIVEAGQAGQAGEEAGAGGVVVGDGDGTNAAGPQGETAASRSGVADDLIKLGATVAEEGIAADFLGEVRLGMEAVRTRVNRAGGIHGRQLQVIYRNDAWDPSRGRTFIENLIREEEVFAFAVSPSSEGLNAASNAGIFERHGVPVVGADGLNNSQFINIQTGEANPWIWPVASATTTQAHIIMKNAWDRAEAAGVELRPAIVFGNTYRFGVEGAFAFNQAFKRLSGEDIPGFTPGGTACREGTRFCGVAAGERAYTGEIDRLQGACRNQSIAGGRCNFLLLLLEPATAQTWMPQAWGAEEYEPAGGCCGIAGAQPLFTRNFATTCATHCHRMIVWTGYNPPCCSSGNRDVAEFAQSLPARADRDNQFTLGGYLGMTLLAEALQEAGRDLTRERLVQALNSMTLRTGITHPDGLRWSADNKYANIYARSWRINYGDSFNGFDPQVAPFVRDPWPGQDNRLP